MLLCEACVFLFVLGVHTRSGQCHGALARLRLKLH